MKFILALSVCISGMIGQMNYQAEWVYKTVLVERLPQDFEIERDLALARASRQAARIHIRYVRDQALEREVMSTQDRWVPQHLLLHYSKADIQVVEVVSVVSGEAIRRVAGGKVTVRTLKGDNPFSFSLQGGAINVAYLNHPYGRPLAFVYSATLPLDENTGKQIDNEMARRFGDNVGVHVRGDFCFLGVTSYPTINPFAPAMEGKECEQYWRRPALWCRVDRKRSQRICSIETVDLK